MEKAIQTTLHMTAIDGELQENSIIMEGTRRDMLAIICLALRMFLSGEDTKWRRTANKVIGSVFDDFLDADETPLERFLSNLLYWVTLGFALFGAFMAVGMIVTKIAGRF